MDIRFLETFIAVAEHGSMAEAARRLNLTPAAVAQRLRSIENDLGQELVTRVGRQVQPTAAGIAALDQARRLVAGLRDLRVAVAQDEPAGQLRIGAVSTSLTGLLPAIINRLRTRYQRLEYYIQPGASVSHYDDVMAGDLDAAIIVRPQFQLGKSTGWLTLRQEPMVLIAPAETPPDTPRRILETHPFIRYDRNQWGGQIVDRYLRQQRLRVHEWLEIDALEAIAGLVDRGLGVAIVPDWAPPWPEGLRLQRFPLTGAGIRETGIMWRHGGARTRAVQALIEICRALYPDSSHTTPGAATDHPPPSVTDQIAAAKRVSI